MNKEKQQESQQLEYTRFRSLQELSFNEFSTLCSDDNKRLDLRNNIMNGDVHVIRQVLAKETSQMILKKIITLNIEISNDPKILEGIKNVYFESNNLKAKKTEYSSVDKSWYFFPWNKEEIGLSELIQPIFNNVILLNNQKINEILKKTPIDGFVQRFHLINYPPNSGQISLHIDPLNISQVNSGIYLTELGLDYKGGGFYVLNDKDEKVELDKHFHIGDMVLFSPGLRHGVSAVEPMDSKIKSDGRYFLNMNLIQSHHAKDRIPALGIDL